MFTRQYFYAGKNIFGVSQTSKQDTQISKQNNVIGLGKNNFELDTFEVIQDFYVAFNCFDLNYLIFYV